jgi:hypothetical protein
MGQIQLLMGSPDGPSLMVGKILWSHRGRNGLKVVKFCLGLVAHFLAFLKMQSHRIFLRVKK